MADATNPAHNLGYSVDGGPHTPTAATLALKAAGIVRQMRKQFPRIRASDADLLALVQSIHALALRGDERGYSWPPVRPDW